MSRKTKPKPKPKSRFTESKAQFTHGCIEKLVPFDTPDGRKAFVRHRLSWVEITTDFGDKVKFGKSNRSETYSDSRETKKRLDDSELLYELNRLLNPVRARQAAFLLICPA